MNDTNVNVKNGKFIRYKPWVLKGLVLAAVIEYFISIVTAYYGSYPESAWISLIFWSIGTLALSLFRDFRRMA